MELGVGLPTSGGIASPANIVRVAQEAERLGFAAVWAYERLLRPVEAVAQLGGGEPQLLPENYRLVFDPLETLSYVAAVTDTIKLATSVVDALFHTPVVLARRYATLDQLSGGRVIAGLGQGWMEEEFATANVPLKRKGAGFDEVIAILRAAWGPDPVSFEGRFYQVAPSDINPKPVQSHLPILVGAMTPNGIARAARYADGLNPVVISEEQFVGSAAMFREAAKDAGRDPEGLQVVGRANVPITPKPIDTDRPFLGGSPEQIVEDLAKLEGKGVDHVLFDGNADAADVDELLELLGQIKSLAA